jgi:hypothetical protein
LSKFRNFGEGEVEPPTPTFPLGTPLILISLHFETVDSNYVYIWAKFKFDK